MRDNGQKCFVQAYNVQIAVDAHAQVIVAAELSQQTIDRQELLPLVKSVCSTAQATPKIITADAGYWDKTSLLDPSLKGIEVLVSPDSNPQPPGAPLPPSAPCNEEAIRMREVLASPEGKARYALRKSTVEPVFGQIKEARAIRRIPFTRPVQSDLGMETYLRHTQSIKTLLPSYCRCLRLNQAQHHSCRFCISLAALFH
jgi:hypothetical protein